MKTVAIMQPYFFPYLGYYRLLAAADIFVVYDCVQFPRRGWVHRNQLLNDEGHASWLTLPLKKQAQSTKIKDCVYQVAAQDEWCSRLSSYLACKKLVGSDKELYNCLLDLKDRPMTYLVDTLRFLAERLEFNTTMRCSSEFELGNLKGQARIIELCKQLNADRYINASGGRKLYNHNEFTSQNIELKFLTPYQGRYLSILESLYLGYDVLKQQIIEQTILTT